MKNVHTTEASSPQKRTSSTVLHIMNFLPFFRVIFALLDPDPADQNKNGPRGSGSTKLKTTALSNSYQFEFGFSNSDLRGGLSRCVK
jgi:hypothetical protein